MFMLGAVAAFAMAAGAAPAVYPDPLGPAAAGRLQCYEPNEQKKTCTSIAGYRALGGGRYANTATVALTPDASVTLESVTNVVIRQGAVCGKIAAGDIASAKLRMSGRLLSDQEAAPYLAQIVEAMKPDFDKEICTRYEAAGAGLVAKGTVDGQAFQERAVKWISPKDGYVVGP
jgi:hypothetical protein